MLSDADASHEKLETSNRIVGLEAQLERTQSELEKTKGELARVKGDLEKLRHAYLLMPII